MKNSTSKALLIVFLSSIIYLIVKWNISVYKIQNLCENTKQNDKISEITKALKDSWLLRYVDGEYEEKKIILVHSGASFGRHTCSIEHLNGEVVKTEYVYLD